MDIHTCPLTTHHHTAACKLAATFLPQFALGIIKSTLRLLPLWPIVSQCYLSTIMQDYYHNEWITRTYNVQ